MGILGRKPDRGEGGADPHRHFPLAARGHLLGRAGGASQARPKPSRALPASAAASAAPRARKAEDRAPKPAAPHQNAQRHGPPGESERAGAVEGRECRKALAREARSGVAGRPEVGGVSWRRHRASPGYFLGKKRDGGVDGSFCGQRLVIQKVAHLEQTL
ncbi:PREDICTED: bcl-2-binding component 3 [Nipponia nippon]|uniref:bcl-2-binding component 3 n=1 Tax=Nipponia nippon TaxID=128390 RepID=UPI000511051F|nr:PREDICTED: bcl-2-binding component 3 [Nipponia nippon]